MFTEPITDPFPLLLGELRADDDVSALVGSDPFGRVRVRADEPAGASSNAAGSITYDGDARGPKSYQTFAVLTTLDEPVDPSVPIIRGLYAVRCYAPTYKAARALWAAVVKAMHRVGPRVTNGVGIYISAMQSGGEKDKDPDTDQPVVVGVIRATSAAMAVT